LHTGRQDVRQAAFYGWHRCIGFHSLRHGFLIDASAPTIRKYVINGLASVQRWLMTEAMIRCGDRQMFHQSALLLSLIVGTRRFHISLIILPNKLW
jgi:hypothetical protein